LLLIATLALTALVLPAAVVPRQAGYTARAGASAQLATPALVATHIAEEVDDSPLTPFPAGGTENMTETVRLVLAAYAQRLNGTAVVEPVAVPTSWSVVYLPNIRLTRSSPPAPTPIPRLAKPADLAVTIWPWPSIIVVRGGELAYELRIKNYGRGGAAGALVRLPYARQQLTAIDSLFSDPADWVSAVADDHLDVTFGPVAAGEYRTAIIIFRVNTTLPDKAVISMRASYSWSDRRSGGAWTSNWAPVLIGAGNESAPWVWVAVDPLGGWPGTTHHFFTDRYIPGEGIYTWLNTPDGVRPLELRGIADSMGRVWLDFQSSGLRPGTYQLVLYGARSNLTGVATFYVWYADQ
jgi:hypothetical protein